MIETEVLIVGGGPVGLALAGDLGWRGRACILVEQGDGVIRQSKMDGVGVRTMEFCRRWGIVSDVEGSAYDRDYPQDNVYLTSLRGFELGRQVMPSMRNDRPPLESPQKRERCPQNMFDPVLRRFAERQEGVTLSYQTRLTAFDQDADGVTATVSSENGKDPYKIRARYLVGCDGGRRSVRELLGIGMQGRGVLTNTTNFIFRCASFNQLHDKPAGYRYMFVGAKGVWATIVAINGRDEWRMSIIGNADDRPRYTNQELEAFAHRAMGQPFALEILSVLRWTRIEQVADAYGANRVFIAGDACHLTSPTGGLGMNTGIGDAVDLSWKLAAQLEGWGGPGLLRSYEIERRPIARRITRFSTDNLRVMQEVPHSALVFDDGPEGALARERVGHALGEGLRREWFSKNMHLGNRYVDSPICIYDKTEDPLAQQAEFEDAVNYVPSTRPGCRAPHVWLSNDHSTLDLFGRGFVLFVNAAHESEARPFIPAFQSLGIPLRVEEVTDPKAIAAYQSPLVLIRPDGHVAARWDRRPSDLEQVARIVSGRAEGTP